MGSTGYIILPFSTEQTAVSCRFEKAALYIKYSYTEKQCVPAIDVIVECVYTGITAAPVFKCVRSTHPKCWIKYIIVIYHLLGY